MKQAIVNKWNKVHFIKDNNDIEGPRIALLSLHGYYVLYDAVSLMHIGAWIIRNPEDKLGLKGRKRFFRTCAQPTTQINLCIRLVRSKSLLGACWIAKGPKSVRTNILFRYAGWPLSGYSYPNVRFPLSRLNQHGGRKMFFGTYE